MISASKMVVRMEIFDGYNGDLDELKTDFVAAGNSYPHAANSGKQDMRKMNSTQLGSILSWPFFAIHSGNLTMEK